MSEHRIQNEIRNGLAGKCMLFRANVGKGWTGDVTRLPDGSILIRNPRPFDTGLPVGFSDTFGLVQRVITQDMVGQTIAQFVAGEIKTATGKLTQKQRDFQTAVRNYGGLADVWRCLADALRTIGK